MQILSVAAVLAIYGVGALVLARLPTAAVLFCTLTGSALAFNLLKLGGRTGLAFAAFWICYSVIVLGIILAAHRRALQRAAGSREFRKQKEIISLLLNEFELGASDWLWETDEEGRLVQPNDRLSELLGKPEAAIAGRISVKRPALIRKIRAGAGSRRRCGKEPPSTIARWKSFRNGGPTWWQIVARPLVGEGGRFRRLPRRGARHHCSAPCAARTGRGERKCRTRQRVEIAVSGGDEPRAENLRSTPSWVLPNCCVPIRPTI